MYGIKVNFEKKHGENTMFICVETFEHILQYSEELICPKEITRLTQMVNVADGTYGTKSLHKIGRYLIKYNKYSELII